MRKLQLFIFGLLIVIVSCAKDKVQPKKNLPTYSGAVPAKFSSDIVPIMQTHCSKPPFPNCHTWVTDYTFLKSYVDQGKIENRVLVLKDMPPVNNTDNAPPLSETELQKLKSWIDHGAPDN